MNIVLCDNGDAFLELLRAAHDATRRDDEESFCIGFMSGEIWVKLHKIHCIDRRDIFDDLRQLT